MAISKPFAVQSEAHPAPVTSEQVRDEHTAALLSLTREQRRALQRMQQARQRSHFNGRYPQENLATIFEAEAAERSRSLEGDEAGEDAPSR